jgi:hypothetical protein
MLVVQGSFFRSDLCEKSMGFNACLQVFENSLNRLRIKLWTVCGLLSVMPLVSCDHFRVDDLSEGG